MKCTNFLDNDFCWWILTLSFEIKSKILQLNLGFVNFTAEIFESVRNIKN